MARHTLLAIGGLILLLLGLLAFLGGIGQFQAKAQFDDRLSDDRTRFEQTNATSGYAVCAFNNETNDLDCPDNPYTGSLQWLIGGLLTMAVSGGAIYYDVEKRA
ncbi:MAG: hypothetical protein ABEH59_02495 [Halobacteriales archaeon]